METPPTKGLPFSVTLPDVDRANVYVPATSVDVDPTLMFETCESSVAKLALIFVKAVLRLSPLPALGLVPVFT